MPDASNSQQTNLQPRNYLNILFWIAVSVHILDWFWLGFERKANLGPAISIYLGLAIVATLFFGWNSIREFISRLLFGLGISAIAFFLPLAKDLFAMIPHLNVVYFDGIVLFAAAWPIYLTFADQGNHLSGFTRVFARGYVYFWIFFGLISIAYNYVQNNVSSLTSTPIQTQEVVVKFLTSFSTMFLSIKAGIAAAPTKIMKAWNSTWTQATGQQYYGGQAETTKEKMGVFIENVKEADPTNLNDEPITLWATITAKTFEGLNSDGSGTGDTITIYPLCISDDGSESVPKREVKATPNKIVVSSLDQSDIECTFDTKDAKNPGISLSAGSHPITVAAQFNYKTVGYKKVYFVDYALVKSLYRENIDIFKQYNLEKNPAAIYTNGPVEIGLSNADLLALKDESGSSGNNPSIGFSLKNRWEGKMLKLNAVDLYVPKGLEIDSTEQEGELTRCAKEFKKSGSDDLYTIYSLTVDNSNRYTFTNNINDIFKTFRCSFKLADKSALMEGNPVSTRYFKVKADYQYQLEAKKTILVKNGKAIKDKIALVNAGNTQSKQIDTSLPAGTTLPPTH